MFSKAMNMILLAQSQITKTIIKSCFTEVGLAQKKSDNNEDDDDVSNGTNQ